MQPVPASCRIFGKSAFSEETSLPLSWNEIRDRSVGFVREWADESSEDAEAKSFWDAFFKVFGVERRRLAQFEASSYTRLYLVSCIHGFK